MKQRIESIFGMPMGRILMLILGFVASGTLVYASITNDVSNLQEWRDTYVSETETWRSDHLKETEKIHLKLRKIDENQERMENNQGKIILILTEDPKFE